MNKKTFTAADFQRKPYAKPQINVVEIEGAEIICTSGNGRSLNPYQGDEWSDD